MINVQVWIIINLSRIISSQMSINTLSQEVGIPLVNMALCWCLKNKNVSTVILGASKEDQLVQNLESLKYSDKLDDTIMEKIEAILKN